MSEYEKEVVVRKSNRSRRADDLHATFLNHFDSQIQIGILAAKTPFLLNGAAAVALLAFLGQENTLTSRFWLGLSLIFFILGAFISGLAGLYTYLSLKRYTIRARDNYQGFLQLNTDRDDILDPEFPRSDICCEYRLKFISNSHLDIARKYEKICISLASFGFLLFIIGVSLSGFYFFYK